MKLTSSLLLFAATATVTLAAQTPTTAKPAAKPAGAATAAKPAAAAATCAKLPELSDKIPALPKDLPCAKHLYTITTMPTVKLTYVSPLEGPSLSEDLGVQSLTFSLDYIDTKVGTGQVAGAHSWYTINYTGYLTDGTKFDSSYDRGEPITIPYGQHQVIPGWDTGFAGMKVGGKRRLFIPYQLGYGVNPPQQSHIPPKSELIFDVELVGISETPPAPKPKPAPAPATAAPAGGAAPAAKPATAPATAPAAAPAAAPASTPAAPKP